jgi:hypothetical protein
MRDPATRKKLDVQAFVVPASDQQTPAALESLQQAEIAKWSPIIKQANIKAN